MENSIELKQITFQQSRPYCRIRFIVLKGFKYNNFGINIKNNEVKGMVRRRRIAFLK